MSIDEYGLRISETERLRARCERLERENDALRKVVQKLVLDMHGISFHVDVFPENAPDREAQIRYITSIAAKTLARTLVEEMDKLGDLYQEIALYRNIALMHPEIYR
jgi:hypothetical protein